MFKHTKLKLPPDYISSFSSFRLSRRSNVNEYLINILIVFALIVMLQHIKPMPIVEMRERAQHTLNIRKAVVVKSHCPSDMREKGGMG